MLNKNQSNKWNSWKYVSVFPALVAFVFLFQIEVVAQEKVTDKQENETKSESIDLKSFKIEKDLSILSEGKKILIDGKKASQEELDKLNPNEIEKIDVATISGKKTILVTTKQNNKKPTQRDKENVIEIIDYKNPTINVLNQKIPDDVIIYVNEKKTPISEFEKLNPEEIESIDVHKNKKEIRVFTKKWLKFSREFNFYIDDKKVTSKEYYSFNPEMIESSNANINEKTIRVTTKKNAKLEPKNTIQSVLKQEKNNKPLIIINGEFANSDFNIENIDPDKINSVNVLKGNQAISKYGENANNGVIEITTKDNYKKGFQILQE